MIDHRTQASRAERGLASCLSPELSYAEMVARAAYRPVSWVERAYRRWSRHREATNALDHLCRLDDRHLADVGLSRQDLTLEGLEAAAMKRNGASP